MRHVAVVLLGLFTIGSIQAQTNDSQQSTPNQAAAVQASPQEPSNQPASKEITIPAGPTVLLQLRSPIDTKSAHIGDGIYAVTSFPLTQDNHMVIPAGTYVKGQIMHITRPGRIKGRADLQVHFTTLIFPNGYTLELPGTLENTPGSETHSVSDKEGTIKADGQKAKDAGTIAGTAAGGAAIGGLARGTWKSLGVGTGIGAGVGLIQVLATRGQDIRLESGSSLEMVLQRPLTLDLNDIGPETAGTMPRDFSANHQNRERRRPNLIRRPRVWGVPVP